MPSHEKKSAADLRKELRELRKEYVKPVSRMRLGDISAEIEKLRANREETPAPAATPSSASKKKMMSTVEDIKTAKAMEFPQKPSAGEKKSAGRVSKSSAKEENKNAGGEAMQKKKSKLERLMAMMSDTDEE